MRDATTVFPIDRLRKPAADGTVGGPVARYYGFMDSTPPTANERSIAALAEEMKSDGVGGVVLAGV